MSSQFSNHDEYGFIRADDFNYQQYEEFMSSYLGVLSRRAEKWESLVKGGQYSKLQRGTKLKRFIRKGVPGSHRRGVWMEVSGAAKMKKEEPDLYISMRDMNIINSRVEDQIRTDLPRTFPNNIHFDSSSSTCYQRQLFNILKAFANNNPTVGYCQ